MSWRGPALPNVNESSGWIEDLPSMHLLLLDELDGKPSHSHIRGL